MFRLIRLIILCLIAFVAGFYYSELSWGERCEEKGGEVRGGVCFDIST